MSKELEALENIKHYDSRVGLHGEDYAIIETALKEREELGVFKVVFETHYKNHEELEKHFKVIEKKLKALEIIKEKCLFDLYVYEHLLTKEEYDLLKEVLI